MDPSNGAGHGDAPQVPAASSPYVYIYIYICLLLLLYIYIYTYICIYRTAKSSKNLRGTFQAHLKTLFLFAFPNVLLVFFGFLWYFWFS